MGGVRTEHGGPRREEGIFEGQGEEEAMMRPTDSAERTLWAIRRGIGGRRDVGRPGSRPTTDPLFAIAGIVVLGYLLCVISVGGDFKPTFRFIVPVLPLWAVVVGGTISGSGWLPRASRQWRFGRYLPWAVLLAILLSTMSSMPKVMRWVEERSWDLRMRTLRGRYLASRTRNVCVEVDDESGSTPLYFNFVELEP